MEDKDEYLIDFTKINDNICSIHERPKNYDKYCSTCQKDICNLCEGHYNHKLIDYNSIKPSQEDIQITIEKLNKMNSIDTVFFSNTIRLLKNIKDEYMKKIDQINKAIFDIKRTEEKFKAQLSYNKNIILSFNENKINYYVLKRLINLKFVIDINNYKKKWNPNNFRITENNERKNKDIRKFRSLNCHVPIFSKLLDNDGFTNMWISEKYCKNWGLKEGIREFIQNQFDGIISIIESKENLYVSKVGNKENIDNIKLFINFDFINKKDKKKYGEIRYDKENNILKISNNGLLWLGDFLLGGAKDEKNNSDLIGTFGEGMKLAILALCRLNKNVTIISSNTKYNFVVREDKLFLKDNQPQRCLHFKQEKIENNSLDNISVIINNIDKNEWGNNIIDFLWLLGNETQIYTSFDKNNKELGQILDGEYLKGKIYVKGIFVENIKFNYNKKITSSLGFNVDIQLDRDRNCIPDRWYLQSLISDIISSFCNNNIQFLMQKENQKEITNENTIEKEEKIKMEGESQPDNENKKERKNKIKRPMSSCKIIKVSNSPSKEINKLRLSESKMNNQISREIFPERDIIIAQTIFIIPNCNGIIGNKKDNIAGIENIFLNIIDCLNKNLGLIDSEKLANSLTQDVIEYIWTIYYLDKDKNQYPVSNGNYIINFLEGKNLPKEFYPFFEVSHSLMDILEKSKNYISIEDKFSIYVQNVITVEPIGEYKTALTEVFSKVTNIVSSFDGKNVLFKKFEKGDAKFCYIDQKLKVINFSALKLEEPINNEWKFWIFMIILKFLNVKIEEYYKLINNVFETKRRNPFDDIGAVV